MTEKNLCPCGSEKTYAQCCSPIIKGSRKAKTAEDLLRARYSAFAKGEVDFIVASHHSRTSSEVKREEVEEWSKSSTWLGMRIAQKEAGEEKDTQGTIVFLAQYQTADGKNQDHWEHAVFEKENGDWKFLDAQGVKQGPMRRTEPKIGRNDPCSCGSGKKYKKCCATAAAAAS